MSAVRGGLLRGDDSRLRIVGFLHYNIGTSSDRRRVACEVLAASASASAAVAVAVAAASGAAASEAAVAVAVAAPGANADVLSSQVAFTAGATAAVSVAIIDGRCASPARALAGLRHERRSTSR